MGIYEKLRQKSNVSTATCPFCGFICTIGLNDKSACKHLVHIDREAMHALFVDIGGVV